MNLKALILFDHGSKVPGFEEVMNYHKKRIEDIGIFGQIEIAYVSTEPGVQKVVEKVSCDEVYIVPLFMAHGVHLEELPSLFGLGGRKGKIRTKVYLFVVLLERVSSSLVPS